MKNAMKNIRKGLTQRGFIQACNPAWTPASLSQPPSARLSWSLPEWHTRGQSGWQINLQTNNKPTLTEVFLNDLKRWYRMSSCPTCFCAHISQISSVETIWQLHNGFIIWKAITGNVLMSLCLSNFPVYYLEMKVCLRDCIPSVSLSYDITMLPTSVLEMYNILSHYALKVAHWIKTQSTYW